MKGGVSALSLFSNVTKGFRHTFKTVWHNLAQYLCFFIAIFVVETAVGTLCFAYSANSEYIDSSINGVYTVTVDTEDGTVQCVRHMRVEELAGNAYVDFFNLTNTYAIENGCPFAYIDYESHLGYKGEKVYTANVTLNEPIEENSAAFIKKFVTPLLEENPNVSVAYTPAYNAREYHSSLLTEHIISLVTVFLISVAAVMLLYSLRLNHFKFTYGVYMSFGADFKKLFSTAIGEMVAVSAATFVPSVALSYLIARLVLSENSVPVMFDLSAVGISLLLNALIVLAAVYYPMKRTSKKPPVSLITTQDNSDLVTSPKVSFKIFGTSFPFKYELFSALRFKKYFLKLLLSTSAFCAVFICGAYLSYMSETDAQSDVYAFELEPVYTTVDERSDYDAYTKNYQSISELASSFSEISGIRFTNGVAAGYSFSHMLIKEENNNGAIDYIVESRENREHKYATADYSYTAIDEVMLDSLIESGICTFDGDPYAALQSGLNKVIISESIYGDAVFDFKPGDTVVIAVYSPSEEDGAAPSISDPLETQIRELGFAYKEYTVAAVVYGLPESGAITLGMCAEDVKAITGTYPISSVEIYPTDGDGIAGAEALRPRLQYAVGKTGLSAWMLRENEELALQSLRAKRGQSTFIKLSASLLLVVSPLIWMFSQIMFYKKREREMYTLRAFGAFENDIKKIYLIGGALMSLCSFIVTVAVSTLTSLGLYGISNMLATYGLKTLTGATSTFYKFKVSVPLLVICALVSAVCGCVSAFVPYVLERRSTAKRNDLVLKNSEKGI